MAWFLPEQEAEVEVAYQKLHDLAIADLPEALRNSGSLDTVLELALEARAAIDRIIEVSRAALARVDAAAVEQQRLVEEAKGMRLVYCTHCQKTHAAKAGETPCMPGAWLDPEARG